MGLYKRGKVWWMCLSHNGKQVRFSCETTIRRLAEEIYSKTKTQVTEGKFLDIEIRETDFEELCNDILVDYRINKKKSIDRLQRSIRPLASFFAGMKIINMTSEIVRSYILQRQEVGYSNATVNRELAALKRMISLGERTTPPKVQSKPYIPRLQENNARQGYYEHHEYIALKDALPDYLKSFVTMAYCTGMRKNEMLGLVWSQVDLEAGKIALRCQETKNKESRLIYMCEELLGVIREQKAIRDRRFPDTPWVFFGETGNRIKDFRGSWYKACKKVGLDGRTIHDFRRTAVRNMIRAGVPEKVAMMISGHKTRSVFDRYNIVNEDDLKLAAEKVQEKFYHNSITLDKKRAGVSITSMNSKASFLKLIQ